MESEAPLVLAVSDDESAPLGKTRAQVALYFGILILAYGLAAPYNGGLSTLPITFFLKDHLHKSSHQVAVFWVIAAIPLYLGFLFGFLRDRFRHSKYGDQAYLLGASLVATACFLTLSKTPITYGHLLVGALATTLVFQVINAAVQAMTVLIAHRRILTGWLSAVATLGFTFPGVIGSVAGGWLSEQSQTQNTFLIVSVFTVIIMIQALWRPKAIFVAEHQPVNESDTHWQAIKRLAGHKVFWIPLVIQFLWNFAPAWGNPATYYVTNHLKFSDKEYGIFSAVQMVSFVPSILLYGFVCRRFTMGSLLWVGTIFGILQGPPLLFANHYWDTMGAAAAFGLLGGFGSAAYWDLLLRCCPKGLEGTATMMGWSLYWIAAKSSDLLGTYLYDRLHGGFLQTIIVTTISYALIIPVLFIIPKVIMASREGEAAGLSGG